MDLVALFSFFRGAFPYLIAGAVGFSIGWWIQEFRVDRAQVEVMEVSNKFTAYKIEQDRLRVQHGLDAEKRREETINEWSKKYESLQKDHDIYRRCVAAGKCGGVSKLSGSAGLKLSPAFGVDAARAHAVPAAPGTPEETPQVLMDCAATTLQLNALQDDIEKQGATP